MQGQLLRVLWLLAMAGKLCSGQPAATRTITGVVSNGVTSEPIRRALVQAFGSGAPISAFSEADGQFSIEVPSNGYIQLSVQKPGYTSSQFNGTAAGDTHVNLMPEARITGRILDADGQPVQGVPVQVLFSALASGRRRWMQQATVSTDEDGVYSANSLAAGRYLLRMMTQPAPGAFSNAAPTIYPARYLPVGSDLSSAQQIDLSAGQELTLETKLRPEPAYRVSGSVVGMPPGIGIALLVTDTDGQLVSFGNVVSSETGKFTIENVPAGSWVITAQANDAQRNSYFAQRDIAIAALDISGLEVPVQLQASIAVSLKRTAGTQGQIYLAPVQAFANTQYFAEQRDPQPQAADAQQFVAHVPPGRYRLAMNVVGPGCLSSASSGGVDLLRDELIVSPDSQPEPINISLSSACATLTGTPAATGSPILNAVVVAMLKNQQGSPKIASLATGKTFTLSGLTSGTYEIYAFADVSDLNKLEYANPEALRDYRGQEIELQAGRQANVTVEVNPARRH